MLSVSTKKVSEDLERVAFKVPIEETEFIEADVVVLLGALRLRGSRAAHSPACWLTSWSSMYSFVTIFK